MKTYCPPLESNGCDSGFGKSALCVLEIDDKSMSRCFSLTANLRPTSSSRALGFNATDSALTVLFHDYQTMWAGSTLPVGPNLKVLAILILMKVWENNY